MGCLKITYRDELPTLKVVKGNFSVNKNSCAGSYRYGFNGKEKLNEFANVTGSHLDFGARIYDSRLGRWLSRDPLANKFPSTSPYNFALLNPILFIDPDGKAAYSVHTEINNQTGIRTTTIKKVSDEKIFIEVKKSFLGISYTVKVEVDLFLFLTTTVHKNGKKTVSSQGVATQARATPESEAFQTYGVPVWGGNDGFGELMGEGKLLDESPIDGPPVTPISTGSLRGSHLKFAGGLLDFFVQAAGDFFTESDDSSYPLKNQTEPYPSGPNGETRSDVFDSDSNIVFKVFTDEKGDTNVIKDRRNNNVTKKEFKDKTN